MAKTKELIGVTDQIKEGGRFGRAVVNNPNKLLSNNKHLVCDSSLYPPSLGCDQTDQSISPKHSRLQFNIY